MQIVTHQQHRPGYYYPKFLLYLKVGGLRQKRNMLTKTQKNPWDSC